MKYANLFFLFTIILSFQVWSFEVPILTGPVVDRAGLLKFKNKEQMEKLIREIYARHGVQLQVLTVLDLQGETIEQASIKVVEQWGIGSAKEDQGVLLLISKNDRTMRIEVGQGLEGVIPDAVAKRIIAEVITPYFQAGDYDSGVMSGVVAIARHALPHEKNLGLSTNLSRSTIKGRTSWFKLLLFILFILFIRTNIFTLLFGSIFGIGRLGRRPGGFLGGGGGFGGGGWSGGGGGFSGGGASGRW
ncbi:MAG: hypothetical protein A2381_00020 [Bdellovibrionales bacterium RIFOXYB1_FULL_37_110]|nr:MAG: hypothetical protein A2181_06030 [Bdellovibrionales bacterium RIFOXYA1_FULL_38_20]OFZ49272.1 MAG: hypothetical protein A2417_17205 [Bdellovibrionales bacterium RIFOXYC1_FULL_37_79]OFZ57733.1 MAG: hypothetical protein A2381_00020 [Bdellovibrionales bacterium RIFOXYB1_FULL_37_110]OFZ61533.1 MAG: hypothetical protein A2577_00485 [Bdellovibrionales bacterium RIFOXYD1_FULL_36_51]